MINYIQMTLNHTNIYILFIKIKCNIFKVVTAENAFNRSIWLKMKKRASNY